MTNLIQNLLCKAYEELYRKGIKLNVFFFGLNIHEKVSIGKNLGKLSKSQLINLYSHCDLGMVASMTNISLVPYEMIATGLPIIEFEDGSFSSFFENRSSFLINFDYKNIVEVIEGAVCGEVPLKEIAANAYNQIKKLSWDKTSEEFYNILLSIIIQK